MWGFGFEFPKHYGVVSAMGGNTLNWHDWACPVWEDVEILWEDASMTSCDVFANNTNVYEDVTTNWELT